jgi:glycosyltransferase involved in cell wall biosynthesis
MPKTNLTAQPLVSIVVPALNEELTIGEFVDWCQQGIREAGVPGEILIIDSSTDRTAAIAAQHGARVIPTPKGGLGQAYIDALPHIRGKYIIMGDCDLTYDFRELKAFVDKLGAGYEFVMGTRMRGQIERGAMPFLHRYFGTPLTTWILNLMYGSHFSDIHCGMRGMTRAALDKINLESRSWEYASEMVLKAAKLKLRCAEIPIRFYKDRQGRLSHHKRMGWFSPWMAGWINLKVMFMYLPDFFLKYPGLVMMALGLGLLGVLHFGSLVLGPVTLATHGMLLGMTLAVVGYSSLQLSILSKVVYDMTPERTLKYKKLFTYNKGMLAGFALGCTGLAMLVIFFDQYIRLGYRLTEISHLALLGFLLVILGFQTFTFTLVFQMLVHKNECAHLPEAKP